MVSHDFIYLWRICIMYIVLHVYICLCTQVIHTQTIDWFVCQVGQPVLLEYVCTKPKMLLTSTYVILIITTIIAFYSLTVYDYLCFTSNTVMYTYAIRPFVALTTLAFYGYFNTGIAYYCKQVMRVCWGPDGRLYQLMGQLSLLLHISRSSLHCMCMLVVIASSTWQG
jgi:hypothetical protein